MYETDKYVYIFQHFETMRYFAKNIFKNKINLDEADKAQIALLNDLLDFKKGTRPRDIYREKKAKEKYC